MATKITAPDPEEIGGLTTEQRAHLDSLFSRSLRDAAALKGVIGERFLAARELNGLAQSHAAALLSYESGAQLSLIERGNRLPPLRLVLSAAAVYAVSTDYLMGAVDEPEPDRRLADRHVLMRHVDAIVRNGVEGITAILASRLAAPASASEAWAGAEPAIHSALVAFGAVRSANAELYESEFRGGAKLDKAMDELRSMLQLMSPAMRGIEGQYVDMEAAVKKHSIDTDA